MTISTRHNKQKGVSKTAKLPTINVFWNIVSKCGSIYGNSSKLTYETKLRNSEATQKQAAPVMYFPVYTD